jgi:hypothetical protein
MNRILWTLKQDAGPPARQMPAMAYYSSRGRIVLFGGMKGNAPVFFNDTWEWDGANWTQVADTGPPARYEAAMAYDAQRNQTVLFGGGAYKDTWGWDGRNWTPLADSGLTPRASSPMAYDSKRQRIVLFSGHFNVPVEGGRTPGSGTAWHGLRRRRRGQGHAPLMRWRTTAPEIG